MNATVETTTASAVAPAVTAAPAAAKQPAKKVWTSEEKLGRNHLLASDANDLRWFLRVATDAPPVAVLSFLADGPKAIDHDRLRLEGACRTYEQSISAEELARVRGKIFGMVKDINNRHQTLGWPRDYRIFLKPEVPTRVIVRVFRKVTEDRARLLRFQEALDAAWQFTQEIDQLRRDLGESAGFAPAESMITFDFQSDKGKVDECFDTLRATKSDLIRRLGERRQKQGGGKRGGRR